MSLIKLHAIKLDTISNKAMAVRKKYSNQTGLSNLVSLILSTKLSIPLDSIVMLIVSIPYNNRLKIVREIRQILMTFIFSFLPVFH